MGKRGPKRKIGKRYPSGDLIVRARKVGPTTERAAKRVARFAIAGVRYDQFDDLKPLVDYHENPLELAESWLGVLFAAQVIDREQHAAGNKYHGLYKAMFPQGFPGSVLDADMIIDGQPFEPISDEGMEDRELAWAASERILAALGRRTHQLVKNICVFGRFERFIDTSSLRPREAWRADSINKTRFVTALDALATAYGLKGEELQRLAA